MMGQMNDAYIFLLCILPICQPERSICKQLMELFLQKNIKSDAPEKDSCFI